MSTPRPPHHSGLNESACTACNQYSVHVSNQQSVWHQSSSKTMKSVHRECTTTAQPSICWVLKCATNCKLLLCTANDGAGKRTSQRCYINGQTTHIEPCMSTPRPPHHGGLNESACTACNQYSVHVTNQQSVWHQSSSNAMKSVSIYVTQGSFVYTTATFVAQQKIDGCAVVVLKQICYCFGANNWSHGLSIGCTACNQLLLCTTQHSLICWVLKCATNCKLLLCTGQAKEHRNGVACWTNNTY